MEERRDAEKTPRRFSLLGEGEELPRKAESLAPFSKEARAELRFIREEARGRKGKGLFSVCGGRMEHFPGKYVRNLIYSGFFREV